MIESAGSCIYNLMYVLLLLKFTWGFLVVSIDDLESYPGCVDLTKRKHKKIENLDLEKALNINGTAV